MAKEEKVFEYVVIDDNTSIQDVSILDKIRILFMSFLKDETQELDTESEQTKYELKLFASCSKIIFKGIQPITKGLKRKVGIRLPSKFKDVYPSILEDDRIKNFYNTTVIEPKNIYGKDYYIGIILEVKEDEKQSSGNKG